MPRALCGPGSSPETDIQGRVSLQDRQSGRSEGGYNCNLELAGQYQGEGAGWQHAWYQDCAYFGQENGGNNQTNPGVVVLDVKDSAHPAPTAFLNDTAMVNPHEGLRVNEKRELLAALQTAGSAFGLYDLKDDCAHPKQLFAGTTAGAVGHEGAFAPDGNTYWGASYLTEINAIDVTNPTQPSVIFRLPFVIHGVSISADGNRAYTTNSPNLQILDVSQVQSRAPAPATSLVGALNVNCGQTTVPVTIKGKPYLICVSEGGGDQKDPAVIVDISNESAPFFVSKLNLEIHMAENKGYTASDEDGTTKSTSGFAYVGHYCSVDQLIEPTVLGCGYFWSGLRVFDIRDPYHPKEIAYYIPPAKLAVGGGSTHRGGSVDWCTSQVRFVPARGEIWSTCQDNGFLVLKFTNGAWPFKN